ncbi:MAG: sulfatase [Lentisphaerae bacterium]|nr:sulfatase [Lentisphaerota bacterium]
MPAERPNIVFIMSDDHAAHAIGCYGSRINRTPHLDRIAAEGLRFDRCFCTNSICTPSRATILTGTYNHVNGVTTLTTPMDNRLQTYPKLLQAAGYQTAIFGKWHLGSGPRHCPTGFDDWAVLPGQGRYHNPQFVFKGPEGGETRTVTGYATDLITDFSLDWLRRRDPARPFCLMIHHKAPHRPWYPDEKHARLFLDEDIPEPETLQDDYRGRAAAAAAAKMRVGPDMTPTDLKCEVASELPEAELRRWAYQRYIKDYLRVIASVDDNVGRVLDTLDRAGLSRNTVVIYTSDQGFFLGDHGWFDKRFMYEESLRMPCMLRYPAMVAPGRVSTDMVLNTDFAPLFLDLAGVTAPEPMQGVSLRPLLEDRTPPDWRQAMYYRYWMHRDGSHNVYAHYGIRTHRYKLIYYYADPLGQPGAAGEACPPEWELFDLENDPLEMCNRYHDPAHADTVAALTRELARLQAAVGDAPWTGAPTPSAS